MKVKLDKAALDKAGAIHGKSKDGKRYRVLLDDRSDAIDAKMTGDEIELVTERSASHRAVAAALGLKV